MYIKSVLILLEIAAFMCMGLFSHFNLLEETGQRKKVILWRLSCSLPLIILSFIQVLSAPDFHSVAIFLMMITAFISDIILSVNLKAGLACFMIFQVLNITNLFAKAYVLHYVIFAAIISICTLVLLKLISSLLNEKFEKSFSDAIKVFICYFAIQVFGILVFIEYRTINPFISKMMIIGAVLFMLCDLQVSVQKIAKAMNKKYNDNVHIVINNILYYSALIFYVASTFKIK